MLRAPAAHGVSSLKLSDNVLRQTWKVCFRIGKAYHLDSINQLYTSLPCRAPETPPPQMSFSLPTQCVGGASEVRWRCYGGASEVRLGDFETRISQGIRVTRPVKNCYVSLITDPSKVQPA